MLCCSAFHALTTQLRAAHPPFRLVPVTLIRHRCQVANRPLFNRIAANVAIIILS